MSLGQAMWLARVARKNPRRIPIADFSKRVEIRIMRIDPPQKIEYRRRFWSDREIQRALELGSLDRTIDEIGAELDRPPMGVRAMLLKHNIKTRRSRRQRKRSHGRFWSEQDIQTAVDLFSLGYSVNEIGEKVDRPPQGVRSVLRKRGVTFGVSRWAYLRRMHEGK